MSEAPKYCEDCPVRSGCRFSDIRSTDAGVYIDVPSSQCPFVRLDAKDAEIETLKLSVYDGECRQNKASARIDELKAGIERLRAGYIYTIGEGANEARVCHFCGAFCFASEPLIHEQVCVINGNSSLDNPPNNP